jgi:hypothetical protein
MTALRLPVLLLRPKARQLEGMLLCGKTKFKCGFLATTTSPLLSKID